MGLPYSVLLLGHISGVSHELEAGVAEFKLVPEVGHACSVSGYFPSLLRGLDWDRQQQLNKFLEITQHQRLELLPIVWN